MHLVDDWISRRRIQVLTDVKHGKATLLCLCHVWKGREGSQRLEVSIWGMTCQAGGLGDGIMRLERGLTVYYLRQRRGPFERSLAII